MSDEQDEQDEQDEDHLDLEIQDEEEEPQPVEEPAPTGLKAKLAAKKGLIIAVAFVLLVGGGVAGLYFTGKLTAKKPHEISMVLPGELVYYKLPKITVDIKPSKGHARPFIRLIMQVELQGESAKTAFVEREIKILDAIQTHLRSLTVEDLKDEAGSERLRNDVVLVINNLIRPERAVTVLYKEIMIR